jgi:hypothetical protein
MAFIPYFLVSALSDIPSSFCSFQIEGDHNHGVPSELICRPGDIRCSELSQRVTRARCCTAPYGMRPTACRVTGQTGLGIAWRVPILQQGAAGLITADHTPGSPLMTLVHNNEPKLNTLVRATIEGAVARGWVHRANAGPCIAQ